jgi:hypothetical protein
MKYLESFNEKSNYLTFKEKYKSYIKSGDIVIKSTPSKLEIEVRDDLNIPELEELHDTIYDDVEGFLVYLIILPTGFNKINDYIIYDKNKMYDILKLDPVKLKEYIKNEYNSKFESESYLKSEKIKDLFKEYIN